MNAIAFDTCKAIEEPKAAGFGEARAEAMVHTVGEAFSENDAAKSRRRAVRAVERAFGFQAATIPATAARLRGFL